MSGKDRDLTGGEFMRQKIAEDKRAAAIEAIKIELEHSDYILDRSEILERAAELVEHRNDIIKIIERRLRQELWLNHGHDGLYGDDGEMQCSKCLPIYDYKRAPLEQVIEVADRARMERAAKALQFVYGAPEDWPLVTRFEVIWTARSGRPEAGSMLHGPAGSHYHDKTVAGR
jgi:hypothetical protein